MSFKLNNEYICLDIQEPGEHYKGARFDWTGQIIQITFLNKHTFCTTETLNRDEFNKKGRGLYNEFGIDQPVGYNNCPIGSEFPKIGVGLLTRKSKKTYDFFEDYEIKPYSFSFQNAKAQFICKAETTQEYSFELDKRIVLDKNTFTINYSLFNFGNKVIKTNEYVHNFLSINKKKIDASYKLLFSFPIKPEKFAQSVNPENAVQINKDSISWNSTPKEQFFFSNINTRYNRKENWTLIHLIDKVGIRESTNFKVQKINLWGAEHVISPELFFQLNAAPGKRISWSRSYEVFNFN